MRRVRTGIGLAAFLAACGGGAMLGSAPGSVTPTCRAETAAVTWIAAHSPAQHAVQNAWCAAVGQPLSRTAEPAPARVDSVLVVTWNVKVGGGDVASLIAGLRRGDVPDRVAGARVPRGIHARTPAGGRTSIDDVARALDLSLAYVPSMRNGDRADAPPEDRGNAILSTLALRDVAAIELPLVRQRRVVVSAMVSGRASSGNHWSLQVTSVHLENRPARGLTGVSDREEQMARLLDVLPAASMSVLGGDLNTWARGAREPAVARALQHHAATGPLPADITFDGPAFFNVRLDYLFGRLPGGRLSGYQRADERYGSDHYPVMAWVHFFNG